MSKPRQPALGAEGWFTWPLPEGEAPRLLGSRCESCGTYAFPKLSASGFCPNPGCGGTAFEEVPLSPRGRVWSYTNACYAPPPPFVAQPSREDYEPITLAAVELDVEKLVVIGQVRGATVDDLQLGTEVQLVLDVLFEDDEAQHMTWKWEVVK